MQILLITAISVQARLQNTDGSSMDLDLAPRKISSCLLGVSKFLSLGWSSLVGRYPDSSTTLRLTPDGTKWDSGNPSDYSDGADRKSRVPLSKTERRKFEEAQARDAGKLLRSFVSQCATAYADHKLSTAHPVPPKPLRRIINATGGNVSWLASDPSYRAFFVKAYCRLRGEQVPYEKIWDDKGVGRQPSNASPVERAGSPDPKDQARQAERRQPTAFEKAVQAFLAECATASVRGSPRPAPPVEVRQRYSGKILREWEKSILSSSLFKSAILVARETKAGR
jgi:hypothetical protein